jgi:hypothetical protein
MMAYAMECHDINQEGPFMARKRTAKAKRGRPATRGKTENFSTRITPEIRAALETEARAKDKSVSEVAAHLLREALSEKRDKERNDPARAFCYLIAELSELVANVKDADGRPVLPWHADPWMFEAFKLAVIKLMGVLRPGGEVKSPIEGHPHLANSTIWGPHKSPEDKADWAVSILWHNLQTVKPVKAAELFGDDIPKHMAAEIERTAYGMVDARKSLQVGETWTNLAELGNHNGRDKS